MEEKLETDLKISILTPSFQAVKYIGRAIDCVLDQQYPDVEHIVMDGGSTDGTVAVLEKYPHLKWVSEPDNGQSDAMNKAFEQVTGEVLTYLNADDYFAEGALKAVADCFSQHPDADMVVGNLIIDKGEKQRTVKPSTTFAQLLRHFEIPFPFNPVCYFYKAEVQRKAGPFPQENHLTMDYWFLLHAYRHSKVVRIDRVLGTFDLNFESKTAVNANSVLECHRAALRFLKGESLYWRLYYRFHYSKYWLKNHFLNWLKRPFRQVFYSLFLSRKLSREQFDQLGFFQSLKKVL
jgi:glycosyltransferase involved in cell wall biosynthesis